MELWDAYLKDGRLAGCDLVRGEPVPQGLYHIVCSVLVRHTDGTYLLMKRDPAKPTWPNVYEASAGGSAIKGETAQEAARRELFEETGIRADALEPLYREQGPHTFYCGFLCETDIPKDAIVLQEGETTDYRWVTRETLMEMAKEEPPVLVIQRGVRRYFENRT